MAETGGTARTRERGAQHGTPQGEAQREPAAPTPGLDAARAIEGNGEPAANQIANLLRRYPGERDEILTWMQQHRGNQFAQLVRNHLGTVERIMPEGYELTDVHASIMIPGNRRLTGSWAADVSTSNATLVEASITATGVYISFQPTLFVDGHWGARNAEVHGAHLDFATGRAVADVRNASGISGVYSIRDQLSQKITDAINQGVANTPLARRGYSPTRDTNLEGSMQSVLHSIQALVSNQPGQPQTAAPVGTNEMANPSVGGTVNARLGGSFLHNGSGLVIAPGSTMTVDVEGIGNIADIQRSQQTGASTARGVDAAHVSSVHLSASDLVVQAKGRPVARLRSLTIAPGGAITIDSLELLGSAREAQGGESAFALLVGLIARQGGDINTYANATDYAGHPQIVDAVTRRLIEDELNKSVHDLVLSNRGAVPGIDLARVLGIH